MARPCCPGHWCCFWRPERNHSVRTATALAGFMGNALHGGFYPPLALSCGAPAVLGGWLGSKVALKTKPKHLKTASGLLTIVAAVFMMVNALSGKQCSRRRSPRR
ncbi:MAG: TSUP family transporter [Armatimonadota bacterium]